MIDNSLKQATSNKQSAMKEIKKPKKQRLYNGCVIEDINEYEIIYKNTKYKIKPQCVFVINDYIGSIELAQHKSLGYSIIDEYEFTDDNESRNSLDFTFAKIEDVVHISYDEGISSIKLNSRNLRYAEFTGHQRIDFDIVFDNNILDNTFSFRKFIENNIKIIKSINIQGISENDFIAKIIKKICANNDIFIITFVDSSLSNKTVKKIKKD